MQRRLGKPSSRRRVGISRLLLGAAALLAAGMGSYGELAAGAAPASGSAASVARGKAFAQAHCSGCHAVLPDRFSPNPDAPPFENVVTKEGLTAETLTYWLRHSHNFPEIMNFEVADDQVDDLSAFMLTLRQPPPRRR